MKDLRALLAASAIVIASFGSVAKADTITEIVSASGTPGEFDRNGRDFDILLALVVEAGLAGFLNDTDNLTVFAPNDKAFIKLARDLGYGGYDEEDALGYLAELLPTLGIGDLQQALTAVLTYHVVAQELDFFDVLIASIFDEEITTVQGATIRPYFFILIDNEPDLRNPRLTRPVNLEADNGIIHAINRVLIPVDL